MKFAVISASGSQYIVEQGKELILDKIESKEGDTVSFDVLVYAEGSNIDIGTPVLANRSVKGTIVSHEKGEKIRVARYRAKSRSRRVVGHRSHLTRVKITSIN